jgi:hypothetical protein
MRTADPLARRLTGRVQTDAYPPAVLRSVLIAARRAGYPFEQAWPIAAEAALSHISYLRARDWWEALSATEGEWRTADAGKRSSLAEFTRTRAQ